MVIKLVGSTTKLYSFDSDTSHLEILHGGYYVSESCLSIPPRPIVVFMESHDNTEFHYEMGDIDFISPYESGMELTFTENNESRWGHLLLVKDRFGVATRIFVVNEQVQVYVMNDKGQTIEVIK